MNEKINPEVEESEIESLIRQIKQAVVDADSDLAERNISVEKVDIELNSVLKETPSGKFEFEWGPIKLGGGVTLSNNQISKVKLSISPQESELELMAPKVQKGLSAAIKQILTAVDHANSTSPTFDFQDGSVELTFVISEDAEIKVLGLGAIKQRLFCKFLPFGFRFNFRKRDISYSRFPIRR